MRSNPTTDRIGRWWRAIRRRLGIGRDHPADRFEATGTADLEAASASELARFFYAHDGRLVSKWAPYLDAYEQHFDGYRHGFPGPDGNLRPLRFLEIGVFHGGSLELWRKYFGDDAVIFGIDLDERCAAFDGEAGRVRIGSQADPDFLRSVVEEMGGVDIVLDDGSHQATHLRTTFATLFPLVSTGGLYVVEDLHTSYWRRYGGGFRRSGSFIEVVKDLIDDLHAPYHGHRRKAVVPADEVAAVTVHDAIVFIDKGRRVRAAYVDRGSRSF